MKSSLPKFIPKSENKKIAKPNSVNKIKDEIEIKDKSPSIYNRKKENITKELNKVELKKEVSEAKISNFSSNLNQNLIPEIKNDNDEVSKVNIN